MVYNKTREVLLYLFFGGLTFFISMFLFIILNKFMNMNELSANVYAWIIAVLFAFITNKLYVFTSPPKGFVNNLKQLVTFSSGRIITLILEEGIIYIFVIVLGFPGIAIKFIAQVIVIVLNYIISKIFVFRREYSGGK